MKRFFFSVVSISLFFVGLGVIIDKASAKLKSDTKALEIIQAARTAIGGESKLREVRGLVIVGKSTMTHKMGDIEKSFSGDTEIALQFPDKMMKSIKLGDSNGDDPVKTRSETREVTIIGKGDDKAFTVTGKDGDFTTSDGHVFKVKKGENGEFTTEGGKKIIVRTENADKVVGSGDGETKIMVRKPADGEWKTADDKEFDIRMNKIDAAHHEGVRQNEFLCTTLSLLLTAPDGIEVNYTFAGEGDLDGATVNVINAEFGGQNFKLYIGKSNSLPLAISYSGHPMPEIVQFHHKVPAPADGSKDVVMFKRNAEPMVNAEIMIKFSDFRDAGGVQLPYRWTTTIGDKASDVFDVTSYDINPANISERFKGQEMKMRMIKPDGK